MRRTLAPLTLLPLLLLAACQSGSEASDRPAPGLGAALAVPTVGATTALAWSADILPGTAAAVGETVVYFGLDGDGRPVLTGAAATTGEVLWELGEDGSTIGDTALLGWVTPKPLTIEIAEAAGTPVVIARALDGDLGDADPECADAGSQHAVVAVAVATGEIVWTAHPDPPTAANSCGAAFERDMVLTATTVTVSGTASGGGDVTATMALDSGEPLWTASGVDVRYSTSDVVIGTSDMEDPASYGCEVERGFAYVGLDPATGATLWELDPCEDPSVAAVLSDQVLVEASEGDSAELRAIDALTGEVLASIEAEVLPDARAGDGEALFLRSVVTEVDGADAAVLLLYDAAAAAFTVTGLAFDGVFPYLIWEGHLAVYEQDGDVTRLYDLASGVEAAVFPGWWAGSTGGFRLSTPPEFWSDAEARLDLYTAES